MNPLAQLARQVGVDAAFLAKSTGLSPAEAAGALAEPVPQCSAAELLACLSAVGAVLRFPAAPAPAFYVETEAVDELLFDDAYRAGRGMLPMPRTRGEMRQLVVSLRETGLSYSGVAERLEASLVPRPAGSLAWMNDTNPGSPDVAAALSRKGTTDAEPMVLDNAAKAWRAMLCDEILAGLSTADPFASVRYGYRWSDEGERLVFRPGVKKMPAAARQWLIDSLARMSWLGGRWSLIEAGEQGGVLGGEGDVRGGQGAGEEAVE